MNGIDKLPFGGDLVTEDNEPRTPWVQEGITVFGKRKWHKDLIRDDVREMELDEQRLNERCYYRIQWETHSWCDLSDNICLEDTGNSLFDEVCENNTTREEK